MKKTVLAVALGIMVNMGISAQGTPVIDITNIIAAIENGYTLIQQLQAMYTHIQTSYQQLQEQIKKFESFDFSKLDMNDPLGSWGSLVTYANRMLTYEENIENIIFKKNLKVGKASYSLADVFTTNPAETLAGMTMDGFNFMIDPFERELRPQEKAAFHQKYGMSYGNYMRINKLREMLQEKAMESAAYSEILQENLAEDSERLDGISEKIADSESTVQQQQINNALMTIQAQDIKTQSAILRNISESISLQFAQEQIEKQARQEEINMNDLEIPEGLLKMIDEMQSSGEYK